MSCPHKKLSKFGFEYANEIVTNASIKLIINPLNSLGKYCGDVWKIEMKIANIESQ